MSEGVPNEREKPRAEPDRSIEPIRTATPTVVRPVWDGWVRAATTASRTATRGAVLVALIIGLFGAFVGIWGLPTRFIVTIFIYAPLLAWGAGHRAREVLRRRSLRPTVRDMRKTLAPAELSKFEDQVLISILTSRRVAAQRESRLVTVNDAQDGTVKLTVVEYDMTKIEPIFQVGGGG